MSEELRRLKDELKTIIKELEEINFFFDGAEFVIGCSTSEIIGEHIGKHSSMPVAEVVFEVFGDIRKKYNLHLLFQGCEHINRALTTTRDTSTKFGYEVVSVVPHRSAGGSLSEVAYRRLEDSVVVEFAKADIGIDIGQTLIGMHMKHVAVPVRIPTKVLGSAYITIAKTRPKLIGGERAQYK
ncbi:TIGR01440 family protein [Phocicoccus pinnipedialis]|uniref:UPF0340 protein JEOPIN946_00307 n=1 Tax=Phocicoccus pinnipedialis TaxID=110845 RepID=A0A6V7R3X1_9BACL|nr:TIGR01440 family protein [Jeotgalicoccus pinnipedialis]MBP1939943.1 uncharacterized protein (TIGR01440 family) [Jeotgalicoccus pinnipedialis]CAD2072109.1 hypothetical protein JEOPIN946_00307 [Jeotgalicoccus pinnipedialis]